MDDLRMEFLGAELREGIVDRETVRRYAGWGLALGICLVALGSAAIIGAGLATLTSVLFFGWLLVAGGILQIVHAFQFRVNQGFFLNLLTGILYAVAGLLMVARPLIGAVTLTLLAASFFLVTGVLRAVWAATHRYRSWGWALFSGVLTAVMGTYIAVTLPTSAVWVLGVLIGIEMIFSGWSLVTAASVLRAMTSASSLDRESRRAA